MTTKTDLKMVRALHHKKFRDEQGLFLVQGHKLVNELVASGMRIKVIYASPTAASTIDHPLAEVLPAREIDRLGTLESGNELVAVVHIPEAAGLPVLGEGQLALALDDISDPGNFGTILRIADWFGIDLVLRSHGSVDPYNPKCVQASMGAIFRVQVHSVDLPSELERVQQEGSTIYVASMEGEPVFGIGLKRPAVLVLGNEAHGISQSIMTLDVRTISIPGSGRSESLNVASAASALCMEFYRRSLTP